MNQNIRANKSTGAEQASDADELLFRCASCGQSLSAPLEMAGESIFCPKCMEQLDIPHVNTEQASVAREDEPEASSNIHGKDDSRKPNLFWRRVSASVVDLSFLSVLMVILGELFDVELLATLSTCVIFFVAWFVLHIKLGMSLGKLLLQVRVKKKTQNGEKALQLLGRFSVTWLPFMATSVLGDLSPSLGDGGATFFQVFTLLLLIWFVAIIVSLMITKGRAGLHDLIVQHVAEPTTPNLLSPGHKVMVSLAIILGVAVEIWAFVSEPVEPYIPAVQSDSTNVSYDRNAFYSPAQIRAIYQDRVFEVQTSWNQWGGFLWLDQVRKGSNGSALMFANNRQYGLLVTNWHVVQPDPSNTGGYSCRVKLPNDTGYSEGVVIAKGKYGLDLALILIKLGEGWEPFSVPYSPIQDLQQGEYSVAIGNALGYGISVTDGVVSMVEDHGGAQMIRTSTPVSPGNSGGPLFLRRGALLAGVIVSGFDSSVAQNINFAIPAAYIPNAENWEFRGEVPPGMINLLQGNFQ